VEVLDASEKVLAVSQVISGDRTKARVELPELSRLAGKPVKFRFHLTQGSLHAFWVTPDKNGASGGYLGAGGPDFGGAQDLPQSR